MHHAARDRMDARMTSFVACVVSLTAPGGKDTIGQSVDL
jgi:hypothetical protein